MKNYILVLIIGAVLFGIGLAAYRKQQPTITQKTESKNMAVVTSITSSPESKAEMNEISLLISSPVNNSTVSGQKVTVQGKTLANADVSVNEQDFKADGQGNFSVDVILDEGDNIISILAVDSEGNAAEKELTITYNSGETYE